MPEQVGAWRVSGALACSDLCLWHRVHYFHRIWHVGKLRHGGSLPKAIQPVVLGLRPKQAHPRPELLGLPSKMFR